jgi:hypothetical protein
MVKTTLYLPDDLKHNLEEAARRRGISEADLYREALQAVAEDAKAPEPETGFIRLPDGCSNLSERVDDELTATGFGEW